MSLTGQYSVLIIPYWCFVALSIAVFLGMIWRSKSRKRILEGLFIAYCIQVIYFVIFSAPVYLAFDATARESITALFGSHPFLFKNLIPFTSIIDQVMWQYYDVSVLLNVIFTIPFGILMISWQIVHGRSVKFLRVVWQTMLFSIVIETTQLVLNYLLQYRHRIVTIDDVLMNVIGGMIGAGIAISVWKCVQMIKRRSKHK